MIAINLKPGQKRKRAAAPGAALADRLKALRSSIGNPIMAAAIAAWVVVAGGLGFLWVSSNAKLGELEPRLEAAKAEQKRFQGILQQKRKQEAVKDSLESQINTIRSVDSDRYVWPHLLDEATRALPPYTWLTAIQTLGAPAGAAVEDSTVPRTLGVQIVGRTVDIQAYTRYLRDLEASPWVANVTPVTAQTVIEANRPITAFTIKADYTPADSAFLTTVPLIQSVR